MACNSARYVSNTIIGIKIIRCAANRNIAIPTKFITQAANVSLSRSCTVHWPTVIMAWRGAGTALTAKARSKSSKHRRLHHSHAIVSSLHVDCCIEGEERPDESSSRAVFS